MRWVAAVAMVLGCGGGTQIAPASHAATATAPIAVVELGAEPRRVVRYELAAGTTERLQTEVKLRMALAITDTTLAVQHQAVDLPTLREVARLAVERVAPSGDAVVTAVVEEAGVLDDVVDPVMRKRAESIAATLKGTSEHWRLSPSGAMSDVTVSPALRQIANVDDALRDAAVRFPEVAIGVGARWQVAGPITAANATWQRTTTYRLTALSDTTATVAAEVAMTAADQPLSVEPNASARLTSAHARTSAEVTVPLRGLAPDATSRTTSEINTQLVRGRLRITSSLQTETLASMKRLPR